MTFTPHKNDLRVYPIPNADMAVREQGQGVPVLLIHGFPFDHSIWNRLFDVAASWPAEERNLRLIAPDLRGFGASMLENSEERADGVNSMEQFADDLHALLDAMNIRERIVLCGLSMGGYVAMQYLRKYGETVAKLVLCNTKTTADTPQQAETRRQQAEKFATAPHFLKTVAETMIPNLCCAKTKEERPEILDELRHMIESNNPLGAAAAARGMAERPDTTELLSQKDIPILFVSGSEDKFSTPEEMRQMASLARHKEEVHYLHAAHLAPVEQAAAFAHKLRDFCIL